MTFSEASQKVSENLAKMAEEEKKVADLRKTMRDMRKNIRKLRNEAVLILTTFASSVDPSTSIIPSILPEVGNDITRNAFRSKLYAFLRNNRGKKYTWFDIIRNLKVVMSSQLLSSIVRDDVPLQDIRFEQTSAGTFYWV